MSTSSALATARIPRNTGAPSLATPVHRALSASRSAQTDLDRARLVERAALAAALDRELRGACRAEAAARRVLGLVARELLRRRAHGRLGFARLSDYAAERLGVSARALQTAARVATRLDGLPSIAAAFARGELSWTQVRLLCEVAAPADEVAWVGCARGATVDALAAMLRGDGSVPAEADDDLLDGEPAVRLRIACPGRVRALWRRALELARRVAGEPLVPWRAAEVIAAEGIAGRPVGTSVGDRVWRALLRPAPRAARVEDRPMSRSSAATPPVAACGGGAYSDRGSGDAKCASIAACAIGLTDAAMTLDAAGANNSGAPAPANMMVVDTEAARDDGLEPLPDIVADLADVDAFELDARLRAAVQTICTIEPRIGQRLRLVIDHQLYDALGFRSVDAYVRDRLGLSARKAWALVKVERTARCAPAFAAAYGAGTLS